MSGRVTLVLGGARSGKSSWAERLAARSGRRVLYVATAQPSDAEMVERIAAHRASRPAAWQTIEVFDDLVGGVRDAAGTGEVVLVDCLTIWVSNVVLERTGPRGDGPASWPEIQAELVSAARSLVDQARAREQTLILVSNEVGLGLVPPYPLGRRYRDLLGVVNRTVAGLADSVVLLIAGLPIDLRRLPLSQEDLL